MRTEEPRKGFTLLELLVVIAIIGILVGIMMPVVSGLKIKAKKRQTEAEVRGLALAIRAYHTEYAVWPVPAAYLGAGGTWSNNNIDVFGKLVAVGNPHNINFIEGSSSTNSSLCDPFGTNRYYVVTISVTNNSVTVKSPSDTTIQATY
jgi:prepilin-type N-terminal cleavage/methylation domain-containing protein